MAKYHIQTDKGTYEVETEDPPSAPDTFMGESGLQGLGAVGKQLANSGHTINPQDIWGVLKNAYQGQAAETGAQLDKAKDAFQKGNYMDALGQFIGGTPLIGHPLVHGAYNLTHGNASGLAGDLLSLLGPKAADLATEGASTTARTAGQYMYRSRLPFGSDVSRADIAGAVNAGLDQALPAQTLFPKPGKDTLSRIGSVGESGTLLDNMNKEIQPYVTGANGAQKVDMGTVLAPFLQKVKGMVDAPTQAGRDVAASMLQQARPMLMDADPATMGQIFNKDPQAGPVFDPATQAHLIETWAGNNRNSLDVAGAHALKQKAYKTLASSAYSDKASEAAPSGAKDTNVSLAAGAKNAVNEVHPQVAMTNELMHHTITLTDALNAAAKESPKEFNILTNLAVGGTIGGGAHMGGLGINESAGAGLAGVIALKAVQSPRVATQLGILMGKRFPQVADAVRPLVLPAGATGSGLGQLTRSLGNQPVQ